MEPERWPQIEALYHAALERPPAERAAWLAQACAGDAALQREVEELLRCDDATWDFIEDKAVNVLARQFAPTQPSSAKIMLQAGQQLGAYQILALLGKGGMGEVYRARDTRLAREVAIKVLPADYAHDADRLRRFEQEARATSALNHPNILTIYEFGAHAETPYIVEELLEGENLRAHLARGALPPKRAIEYAKQIAAGLAAAHDKGIVHRDLKPENLFLTKDGRLKILDFGLAKLKPAQFSKEVSGEVPTSPQRLTQPGVVMGTISYMSPEQIRGEEADARSDIFAFGIILYELLSGQPPFAGVNAIDVMAAILDREPPPLKQHAAHVPDELQRIVTKALRKDREQRYQTSKDLLLDLRDCREELAFAAKLERTGQTEKTHAVTEPAATAPTNETAAVNTTSSASIILAEIKRHKRGVLMTLLAAVVMVGIGFGFYQYQFRRAGEHANKPATAVALTPFTSFAGEEFSPAFSPDGNQIAFVWNGEQGDNYDIYVKLVDAGAPLRLTSSPAAEFSPAWSPDGRFIAFGRYAKKREETGIFIVPALGGAERQLHSGSTALLLGRQSGLSWSPDGKQLVFATGDMDQSPGVIFKLTLESLEKQQLLSPRPNSLGDYSPVFSPDGTLLAFIATSTKSSWVSEIYVVPVAGGEPRRLTFDNKIISGLTWSADGRELIFSSDRIGNRSLWRIPVSGGNPERIAGGENAGDLAVSRQGQRLAFSQEASDTNIWRVELASPTATRGAPVKLIASTRLDDSQQYSPDGSQIVFGSNRSGHEEIWVCNSDGSNQTQLTHFNGPPVGSPRWSPDGKQIAFDAAVAAPRDIYVVSLKGGNPRRLTTEPSDEVRPSWSHDGQWIYFASNRGGDWQIWKAPVGSGAAVQVTKQGGRGAVESPDGNFVYFARGGGITSLWRIPVTGGEEVQVLDNATLGYWSVFEQGIYFLDRQTNSTAIEFFSFITGRKTSLVKIEKRMQLNKPSFAVSADGRWLSWAQIDHIEKDIMLMENFR